MPPLLYYILNCEGQGHEINIYIPDLMPSYMQKSMQVAAKYSFTVRMKPTRKGKSLGGKSRMEAVAKY